MSRHDYPLTQETIAVLNGNCPAVADEMSVKASNPRCCVIHTDDTPAARACSYSATN